MNQATSIDIVALRGHLFATLEALKDKDKPMDIERARAINDTAQTIINSAKVEVDFLKTVGGHGTEFIPLATPGTKLPADTTQTGNVITHRLRG